MAAEKQKPVVKIRCYPVQAAIWRNETSKGAFHTVTFSRTYKNDKGEYHDTDSFSGPQLLQLAHLAAKAYDKAEALTRAARAEAGAESDDDVTEYDQPTGQTTEDDDIAFD
jgi:hypothetical protein